MWRLEAIQKVIEAYHDKRIDVLKLGCKTPILTIICVHKSTDYKMYSLFPSDSELATKVREYMTSDPSIVFTRKAVANNMFIR